MCSCVSPASYEDYALASRAIKSAEEAHASLYSTSLYLKAMSYFRQGTLNFKRKDYGDAKVFFLKARKMAEKAELISFLKKSTGEGGLY